VALLCGITGLTRANITVFGAKILYSVMNRLCCNFESGLSGNGLKVFILTDIITGI